MNFDVRARRYGIGILKAEDHQPRSLSKFINLGFARESGTRWLRAYPKTLIVILRSTAVPAKAGKDLSFIETILNSPNGALQKDPSLRSG